MMPADDITYQIPTESVVDCEACDQPCRVTIWDDIRTGAWEYEFTCVCGHTNRADGNSYDRGLANVLFILVITGAAVATVGLLGRAWALAAAGVLITLIPLAVVWYVSHTRKAHK